MANDWLCSCAQFVILDCMAVSVDIFYPKSLHILCEVADRYCSRFALWILPSTNGNQCKYTFFGGNVLCARANHEITIRSLFYFFFHFTKSHKKKLCQLAPGLLCKNSAHFKHVAISLTSFARLLICAIRDNVRCKPPAVNPIREWDIKIICVPSSWRRTIHKLNVKRLNKIASISRFVQFTFYRVSGEDASGRKPWIELDETRKKLC